MSRNQLLSGILNQVCHICNMLAFAIRPKRKSDDMLDSGFYSWNTWNKLIVFNHVTDNIRLQWFKNNSRNKSSHVIGSFVHLYRVAHKNFSVFDQTNPDNFWL